MLWTGQTKQVLIVHNIVQRNHVIISLQGIPFLAMRGNEEAGDYENQSKVH